MDAAAPGPGAAVHSGASFPAMRAAKVPRSLVAGPYGHPFHPVAVTIPIGAWSSSLVFDLLGLAADDPRSFAAGSRRLIVIGLVGAVGASVLGLMDMSRIPKGTPARRTALVHLALNVTAMVLFTLSLVARMLDLARVPMVAFLLSLIASSGLGVSGWLGGKLAYRWGVRVADENTQREGFEKT
ncbi:putative membrane protein [Microbacterium proteolyticum]|nr:putative membrane protein [Microbacterium sp. SORGH_AS_0344]MDQ1169896.1 putative membrane protein [Microbacterium proteolyticum]